MSILKAGRPSGRTDTHIAKEKNLIGGTTRLNVDLSTAEYRRAKMFALDRDQSLSDIVREALAAYMSHK